MAISRADLFRGRLRSEPVPSEAPLAMVARIGAACLSYTGTDCRMCGDHCDHAAIRFRPLGRGRWLPIIEEGGCTGCGDCAVVCPVKAVTMEVVAA
ncbi:4Fe-4S dicluster domain-containing protein [Azospirillum brasilense]|uniref:4Fe-4S dicluster domain-containing protein n=1 Tax=Azospirillum brasilense TaxID=192 RepID=UPI000E6814DE|nr:4Fe-4S dicluster domain-containing protein [Azospirillum brasilense]NUB24204.1 4Fe-4S dicluster domain-containing protein [Azospirillum brasilense]NUB31267.1 4Fe-4S dicluster domain-containing protein [Azospirillum brasilense]RIW01603.1 4Fe-4S dicluster domain-containing protein [Azospirillum brasilense]